MQDLLTCLLDYGNDANLDSNASGNNRHALEYTSGYPQERMAFVVECNYTLAYGAGFKPFERYVFTIDQR